MHFHINGFAFVTEARPLGNRLLYNARVSVRLSKQAVKYSYEATDTLRI